MAFMSSSVHMYTYTHIFKLGLLKKYACCIRCMSALQALDIARCKKVFPGNQVTCQHAGELKMTKPYFSELLL